MFRIAERPTLESLRRRRAEIVRIAVAGASHDLRVFGSVAHDATAKDDQALARLVALVATLAAFLLRIHHLDYQSFWRDEMDAVFFATRTLPELGQMYLRVGENGPLYFTLLHFWLLLVGHSDFAVRYSSLLVGVAAVPLLYVLGARLFGHVVGALAAVLLAADPYHVWYSQEAKMYALVALVAILSVLLLDRALRSSSWAWWVAWLILLGAGFYLHFFMALLIVTEALFVLIAWRLGWQSARRGSTLLFVLALSYLPLAVWQVPALLHGLPTSYQFVLPNMLVTILLAKFSVGLLQPTPVAIVLFAFLFLSGVILSVPGTVRIAKALVIGWTVLPLVLFFLVSLRISLFLDRYLIIILPAYILLLGRGLFAVARRSVLATGAAVLGIVLLWAPAVWNQPLLKQDFKRSVAYLEQHRAPRDVLLFIPSWERTYFDYYHPAPYRWISPPSIDQSGLRPATTQIKQVLRNPEVTLWLVSVEPQYGDRHRQLQGWLDRRARLIGDVPFANLELRHYRGPVR